MPITGGISMNMCATAHHVWHTLMYGKVGGPQDCIIQLYYVVYFQDLLCVSSAQFASDNVD